MQHYREAIDCYKMMVLVTGGMDPLPYLGMGYCYLSLNEKKVRWTLWNSERKSPIPMLTGPCST